ncbi:MAG: hypothetical protein FWG77_09650 [Treponema sp.]|nr:hypothetical protein [Treponema sp.]
MKRQIFLVLVLVFLATGGVFAETWWDSYAPGLRDNNFFVNAGIGMGPTGGYSMGIPPISLILDYKLPIELPITVGAVGTFSTWKYTPYSYYDSQRYNITYTNIGIGARGMYHFNLVENLDVYGGLTLGYVIQTRTATAGYTGYPGSSFFLWGSNIGARYFFTSNLGAYLELGYSGLNFASLGVTLKF